MNLFRWISGHFSVRGKALAIYRRGLRKAERHDRAGAIVEYTEVIDLQGTPADVKGMALYNRALAFAASGEEAKATADLQAALAMSGLAANVRQEVQRKIVRMQRKTSPTEA